MEYNSIINILYQYGLEEKGRNLDNRVRQKMGKTEPETFIFQNRYGTKPIDKSYVNVKLKEIVRKYGINLPNLVKVKMVENPF